MSGEPSFDFDFDFKYGDEKEETLERIEQQCDRETVEILWGGLTVEKVDCPEPQSQNEESNEDEDSQDSFERDDVD